MIQQRPLMGPLSYQKIRYEYISKGEKVEKTIHYL